jgi:hypothetical protein
MAGRYLQGARGIYPDLVGSATHPEIAGYRRVPVPRVRFLNLGLRAARLPSPSPCVIPTRVTGLPVARLRDLLFLTVPRFVS